VKISVGRETPVDGWLDLDRWDVADGLPVDIDQPIERIYVERVLEYFPQEELTLILQIWREHPQVSTRTILAIVGTDCDKADAMLDRKALTSAEHADIVNGGRYTPLWRSTSRDTSSAVRAAGWGIASPYDIGLLVVDRWPITRPAGWQFGALCRAIK
jgi:hypothetical protein